MGKVATMYQYRAEAYQTVWEKIVALVQSKRFIASVVAALMTLFGTEFGLDADLATSIVTAIVALVIGDSINPISELLKSRRVWVFIGAVVAAGVSALGVGLDAAMVQQLVLIIAAWIVGDSWRVTMRKLPS
jgi:hypothetical protein